MCEKGEGKVAVQVRYYGLREVVFRHFKSGLLSFSDDRGKEYALESAEGHHAAALEFRIM